MIRRTIILIALICWAPIAVFAQLQITAAATTLDVDNMVQNILVGGGVTVSNITFNGASTGTGGALPGALIASFANGNTTNLGFTSGIVIATGNVNSIDQAASAFLSDNVSLGGDGTLQAIASGTTYDAVYLEFDFVPLDTFVQFRYIFGSEEYPEYVCSSYNDVFGFFISGPNPGGGPAYVNKNIALIPGTTMPVAINTVNQGNTNLSYPASGCQSLAWSSLYVTNQGSTIVFDGFTTPLTAEAYVVPCTPYHIKMAVADVGDHIYDSGVFLEANSFSSAGIMIEANYGSASDTISIEGCNSASITFRLTENADSDVPISFTLGGTAVNGVDYTNVNTSTLIPTGSDHVTITFNPIADGIMEGVEYITVTSNNTACGDTTVTLMIFDYVDPVADVIGDTTFCDSGTASFTALHAGGIPGFTYNWSTSGSSETIQVTTTTTTTVTVTITDGCGNSATADATVTVNPLPQFTLTHSDNSLCPGESDIITADPSSNTYTWTSNQPISPFTGATVTVTPAATATVSVTATDNNGCVSTEQTTVTFNPQPNVIVTPWDTAVCMGESVPMLASGASTYIWAGESVFPTTGSSVSASPTTLGPHIYTVIGTSAAGCDDTVTVNITVNPLPTILLNPDDPIVCSGQSIIITATGSTAGSTFTWDPPSAFSPSTGSTVTTSSSLTQTTQFTVHYTDNNGCTASRTDTLRVGQNPNVSIVPANPSICNGETQQLEAVISPPLPGSTFQWSAGVAPQFGSIVSATPAQTTSYTVNASDANGCTGSASVTVVVNFAPNPDFMAIGYGCAPVTGIFSLVDNSFASCSWNFGGAGTSTDCNPTFVFEQAGSYDVTFTGISANGCEASYTMPDAVSVFAMPDVNFTVDPPVAFLGQSIHFASVSTTSGNHYWDFGDGTETVEPFGTTDHAYATGGEYTVQLLLVDQNGCMDSIVHTVEVIGIQIPNVMTTDNNGFNDKFVIRGVDKLRNSHLVIFNRWGRKIYESTEYKNDWDGDGSSEGTYYYILSLESGDTYHGFLTIIN
ncbi:MAG: choice-of-anchor L domain-containing protein [Bacteroidetes bacterium]|nr:choice-of-anchor L domain-containing protein [Bacteroidota bacterium]MBU1720980.1 choice-of-anchor L domain-containing protein [Bacteroidota bacterium]